MEYSDESNEKFEKLSKAILKAILSSKKIKKLANELQAKDLSFENSHMVIIMNMKALLSINEKAATTNPLGNKEKNGLAKYVVDGRVISENEIKFNEYCSKKFNEKNWLKKIRIAFE